MAKEKYDKKEIIKQLRNLVASDSVKYDATRLAKVENEINQMDDDQINRALLLAEFQSALVRVNYFDWTQEELDVIQAAIESCGIKINEVKKMDKEDGRDDYAFVLDDDLKVVWVNKMNPFIKPGIYNLLGVGLNFPCNNYQTVEELGAAVVETIKKVREYM